MPNFSEMQKDISRYEHLERELYLKQLQITGLLNITQAINDNISAQDLFGMYNGFLHWNIGVRKLILYVISKDNDTWECATSIGINPELLNIDVSAHLPKYQRLASLEESENELINQFSVVIPVHHKNQPIAYAFVGGFDPQGDMYEKVRFITTITNIIAVAIENKRLFKEQIKQERFNREMELAVEMQMMLVPSNLPKSSWYELDSIYKPHMNIGGDYFDFIETDDNKLIFCIGDIAGKGVAAALLMANFQANLRSLLSVSNDLKDYVAALNAAIFRITNGDRFITFFLAEYDKNKRELRYINAGHTPPLLYTKSKLSYLEEGCTILGIFEELPVIKTGQITLEKETLVLTFTDGLTDIKNNKEEYFSEPILEDFVRRNQHHSAKEFNHQLIKYIDTFRQHQDYPDDFTVLTCKVF